MGNKWTAQSDDYLLCVSDRQSPLYGGASGGVRLPITAFAVPLAGPISSYPSVGAGHQPISRARTALCDGTDPFIYFSSGSSALPCARVTARGPVDRGIPRRPSTPCQVRRYCGLSPAVRRGSSSAGALVAGWNCLPSKAARSISPAEVLECYLFGIFGDDIRESLGLPFLQLPWHADNLADGFELSEMARGYRTLTPTGAGPRRPRRDAELGHVGASATIPSTGCAPALKRSFLSRNGSPLLTDGGDYASPEDMREDNPPREDSRERDK